MKQRLQALLTEAFTPRLLDIRDNSHLHVGHVGAREGGESHFRVRMVADAFEGVNRIMRQRLVHKALHVPLNEGVHALELSLSAPSEATDELSTPR